MLIALFSSIARVGLLLLGTSHGSARPVAATPADSALPLYRFFQQHFDSTIVYQQYGAWNQGPDMLILSKQGQDVYFFTYRSPYRLAQGRYMPGGLIQQFSRQEAKFRAALPDTNQYLLLQHVPSSKLKQTWKNLQPARLWQLRAHNVSSPNEDCMIEDAYTLTLWFLTRSGSRNVSFYAPEFYEECEGTEVNRRQAVKARMALEALLKP
ncbi:hypothetical protein J7E24_04370 [Hymenobacter sp. ISL-91]|uniref:hypothetical protein n=1 Tax=Hymenobacter sp. ISL-91 TaxID=2819151 RepID=UPI001BE747B5|nr:hypothetical protein [Hymenobacter sp. ISL-91]MBT2557008.1 hypothetical protein [Hymenobacter sp. ISL-91]